MRQETKRSGFEKEKKFYRSGHAHPCGAGLLVAYS